MARHFHILTVFIAAFLNGCALFGEDTIRMPLPVVLEMVWKNHPMLRQTQLVSARGDLGLRQARGAFDPKFFVESSNKYYEGKNYYDLLHAGLKVPTWFGVEGMAGIERASGAFVNPEATVPAQGMTYAGFSVPIGRDMITDKRRTELARAKLFVTESEYQRQIMLNDLFAEVIHDYINWYSTWLESRLYTDAVVLTERRLSQLRQSIAAGDRAQIDTLETDVLRRNFTIALQEAEVRLIKARLDLSVHLWNAAGQPLEPDPSILPDRSGLTLLDSMAENWSLTRLKGQLASMQPLLQQKEVQIQGYALKYNLAKQQLLPDIRLKYNVLTEPMFNTGVPGPTLWNNYRWGIDAGINLFMRKERAEVGMAGFAVESARLSYNLKQLELNNKLESGWIQYKRYNDFYRQYEGVVNGFEQLYRAEMVRLSAGESDLFIINTRELRWIESRLKQIDYLRKYLGSGVYYVQTSGQFWRLAR